jgi:hypothetical protein
MLSTRLIRLIETHADELATGLVAHLKRHPRTPSLHHFSEDQLRDRALDIYRHLGDWLSGEREEEVRKTYENFGDQRARESLPLSELIFALTVTKNHLLEFAQSSMEASSTMEVLGARDLILKVTRFFDQATFYTACGYERARAPKIHAA